MYDSGNLFHGSTHLSWTREEAIENWGVSRRGWKSAAELRWLTQLQVICDGARAAAATFCNQKNPKYLDKSSPIESGENSRILNHINVLVIKTTNRIRKISFKSYMIGEK